jgi:hypothetical protein
MPYLQYNSLRDLLTWLKKGWYSSRCSWRRDWVGGCKVQIVWRNRTVCESLDQASMMRSPPDKRKPGEDKAASYLIRLQWCGLVFSRLPLDWRRPHHRSLIKWLRRAVRFLSHGLNFATKHAISSLTTTVCPLVARLSYLSVLADTLSMILARACSPEQDNDASRRLAEQTAVCHLVYSLFGLFNMKEDRCPGLLCFNNARATVRLSYHLLCQSILLTDNKSFIRMTRSNRWKGRRLCHLDHIYIYTPTANTRDLV